MREAGRRKPALFLPRRPDPDAARPGRRRGRACARPGGSHRWPSPWRPGIGENPSAWPQRPARACTLRMPRPDVSRLRATGGNRRSAAVAWCPSSGTSLAAALFSSRKRKPADRRPSRPRACARVLRRVRSRPCWPAGSNAFSKAHPFAVPQPSWKPTTPCAYGAQGRVLFRERRPWRADP